jgi:hemoglobin
MRTIDNREHIELLVDEFYKQVRRDELLNPVFEKIIGDQWDHHLNKMYQFWETILFDTVGYKGSPVRKHMKLDDTTPLSEDLFNRWTFLWEKTVDKHFTGDRAGEAKKRAQYMALLMNYKIQHKSSHK